eukprot:g18984.t1
MGPRCSGLTSAPGEVAITDCAGLEALPAPIVEDLSLSFEGVEAILCERPVRLTVRSGSELSWRLSVTRRRDGGNEYEDEDAIGPALRLHNVRVVVEEGSRLFVGMVVEEAEIEEVDEIDEIGERDAASTEQGQRSISFSRLTTLVLEGAAPQGSNGGALEVKHGGEAVFLVPVHFAGNSVADGYSGGALHVDGEATFTHAAHFSGNRAALTFSEGGDVSVSSSFVSASFVSSSPVSTPLPTSSWRHRHEVRRACGGAVSVGKSGRINFWEFTSFEDNYSAVRGGAVCNRGWAKFFRRSFFNGNRAAGEYGGTPARRRDKDKDRGLVGGNGGAVFTDEGSTTTFTRRSSMLRNRAGGSGGALFNAGIVTFETSAEFRANEAAVSAAEEVADTSQGLEVELEAGGGHVFNRGFLHIKGDASFREGISGGDGGAVYTISGEDTVLGGISSFEGNTAGGVCENVFSSVAGSEVKLTTTSATSSASAASAIRIPVPAAAKDADMATMDSAALATTSPTTGSTAAAGGMMTRAPIGAKPRRRVSRVSSSA